MELKDKQTKEDYSAKAFFWLVVALFWLIITFVTFMHGIFHWNLLYVLFTLCSGSLAGITGSLSFFYLKNPALRGLRILRRLRILKTDLHSSPNSVLKANAFDECQRQSKALGEDTQCEPDRDCGLADVQKDKISI